MKKGGIGGSSTVTGKDFEKTVNLSDAVERIGYKLVKQDKSHMDEIIDGNGKVAGYSCPKHKMRLFFAQYGRKMTDFLSHELLPDEAIYDIKNNHMYIIEKKFQTTSGSTDKKIQTGPYKKFAWEKSMRDGIGVSVSYSYVLNNWFMQPRFDSVIEYLKDMGCTCYFNRIPIEEIFYNPNFA